MSTQDPAGLAPQQVELGNVQADPDPQRQVLFVQVFAFLVQLALPQQLPSTQSPSQQMPFAADSVSHRVKSWTGVYRQVLDESLQAPVLQTTSAHDPQSTRTPQLFRLMPHRGSPPGGSQVAVGDSGVQQTGLVFLVSQTCPESQQPPLQQTCGDGQSGPDRLSATTV